MGRLSEYDTIERDIIDSAAKRLAEEIDFGIITDLLISSGWTKVVLTPMTHETSDEIDQWIIANCKGRHHTMGLVWVFEKPVEANWFKLRWLA